jgi:hypothetical protein
MVINSEGYRVGGVRVESLRFEGLKFGFGIEEGSEMSEKECGVGLVWSVLDEELVESG